MTDQSVADQSTDSFRDELRSWLRAHAPRDLEGASMHHGLTPDELSRWRAWNRTMADARYAAISWPIEWGGRGAGVLDQVVYAEEMHRARAPGHLNGLGLAHIAPAIIGHGSDEQKQWFLPRMLRSDDIWCQGYSEPDAGSDLASLSTRGAIDGDDLVISGQKIWNTFGNYSNYCQLLVRTDPTATPRHAGISCVLVDMTLPGVSVRPLRSATGYHEFNELFFDEVRVPMTALLGPLHGGWNVAMTTLAYERGNVVFQHLRLREKIGRLLTRVDQAVHRQRAAQVYLEGELLKLLADRTISGELHGRPMGPEASVGKLLWSECEQHVAALAGEVLGADAYVADPDHEWAYERMYTRALTIAGGTTQVQKNIIAQRILGLPRR